MLILYSTCFVNNTVYKMSQGVDWKTDGVSTSGISGNINDTAIIGKGISDSLISKDSVLNQDLEKLFDEIGNTKAIKLPEGLKPLKYCLTKESGPIYGQQSIGALLVQGIKAYNILKQR